MRLPETICPHPLSNIHPHTHTLSFSSPPYHNTAGDFNPPPPSPCINPLCGRGRHPGRLVSYIYLFFLSRTAEHGLHGNRNAKCRDKAVNLSLSLCVFSISSHCIHGPHTQREREGHLILLCTCRKDPKFSSRVLPSELCCPI